MGSCSCTTVALAAFLWLRLKDVRDYETPLILDCLGCLVVLLEIVWAKPLIYLKTAL